MKVLVVHIWLLLLLLYQANRSLASGQCSVPTVLCCLGLDNGCYRGCYCDEACLTIGDCCPDYNQTCFQSHSLPSSPSLPTTLPTSTSSQTSAPSPSTSLPPSTTTSTSSQTSAPSSTSPTTSSIEPLSGHCSVPTVLCCLGLDNGCYRGCFCDEACLTIGDCCPDYNQTCFQSHSLPSSPSSPTTLPTSTSSQTTAPSSTSPTTSSVEPLSAHSLPSSPSSPTTLPTSTSSQTTAPSSTSPTTSSVEPLSGHCSVPTVLCCLGLDNGCYRGCFCDEACLTIGDCCPDYNQTCFQSHSLPSSPSSPTTLPTSTSSQTTAPSSTSPTTSSVEPLSGHCSVPTVLCCLGLDNGCYRGCFCDEACLTIGDCCPDYNQTCFQSHSQPSSPSSPLPTWSTAHSPTLPFSSTRLPVTSPPSSSPHSSTSPKFSSSIETPSVCNTCTENETCQKRGGVYGCGCLQGQLPNPEIFDALETCASSTGFISLSRCQLFESGFHPENLHLNDPSCKGTLENGRLLFYFDNEGHICGTTLTSNRTHFIYQNSIQSNPRNTDQSIITREIWMNMTFSCAYPLIQTLSMPMGVQAEGGLISEELPAGQGTYQIRMIPYHDAQFTSPYDGQVQVEVNQQMYVAVDVEGVDRNQIATVLDNCWATPVNDSDYHIRWNLIMRECQNPDDGTVEVLQNGNGTTSYFSFRMFTFSGISDRIFLHCQVHLCLVQNGRCALSCDPGYRRRRRRSLDFYHSAAITMGL
uniref:Uncharacterized protein n=1 Tax=Cyprinus carpio carpio TaxID=630221 RepID=A0A9J8CPI1_CYPCA